jgi:hypothetical protein
MARQALGLMGSGGMPGTVTYEMTGKLNGPGFSTVRFQNKGDLELPTGAAQITP